MSKELRILYGRNLRDAIAFGNSVECGICHQLITDEYELTIDHILPRKRGGEDILENLQPAHKTCNVEKGHRFQHEVEAAPPTKLSSEKE